MGFGLNISFRAGQEHCNVRMKNSQLYIGIDEMVALLQSSKQNKWCGTCSCSFEKETPWRIRK